MQLTLPLEDKTHNQTLAKHVPFGKAFRIIGDTTYYMRVKPVNFLLNSTLLNDVINRGDIFRVNIESGAMHSLAGDTPVKLVYALVNIDEHRIK